MNVEPENLLIPFLLGALLAAAYLAMLWYSLRRLADSRHAIALVLGGAALRLGLLVGVFYLVMDGRWERLLACFAGFLLVRIAVTRLVGLAPGRES